jgi:hypothetical protein
MSTFTTRMTTGLLLVTVITSSSANQEKSTPRSTAPLEPIIVKLTAYKPRIHPGDSIELRAEVWNNGSATLFIGRQLDASNKAMSRLELYLEHDSRLDRPMSNSAADYIPDDKEPFSNLLAREWLPLAPNHFYGQTVVMSPSDFPRLRTPGRYQVRGRYISEGFRSPREDNPLRTRASEISQLPYSAWEGETETNPVWIAVEDRSTRP